MNQIRNIQNTVLILSYDIITGDVQFLNSVLCMYSNMLLNPFIVELFPFDYSSIYVLTQTCIVTHARTHARTHVVLARWKYIESQLAFCCY